MARMRMLKPDFWSDKNMVKLSAYARLLYLGMWNFALCERGHLPDDIEELQLKILPRDPVDPEELLDELLKLDRVRRMTLPNGGGTYLWVPRLSNHQKTDERWKTRCPYCAAETPQDPTPPAKPHRNSRESQESFGEPQRDSPKNTGAQSVGRYVGREGREVEEPLNAPPVVTRPRHARDLDEPPANNEPPGEAEKIMTRWASRLAQPPQQRIATDLGRIVAEALRDGCAPADVAEALDLWQNRPRVGPAVLVSIIHEIANPPRIGAEIVPIHGRASPRADPRPSTTDRAVAVGVDLVHKYRAIEAQEAIS